MKLSWRNYNIVVIIIIFVVLCYLFKFVCYRWRSTPQATWVLEPVEKDVEHHVTFGSYIRLVSATKMWLHCQTEAIIIPYKPLPVCHPFPPFLLSFPYFLPPLSSLSSHSSLSFPLSFPLSSILSFTRIIRTFYFYQTLTN